MGSLQSGRIRAAALSLGVACAAGSRAWTDTGHMVIAAIAETNLTPRALSKARELLQRDSDPKTNTFLTASCWADDSRTKQNAPWHYINLHFRPDGKPSSHAPERENVVWAIEQQSKVLGDPKASEDKRRNALKYVLHFVGDVHQPLHCVARDTEEHPEGDRGGNLFTIGGRGEGGNLHFLWDTGVGLLRRSVRPLGNDDEQMIRTLAADLQRYFPKSSFAEVSKMDPEGWAREGLDVAKTIVYSLRENEAPGAAYVAVAQYTAARRLALAGYRLAALLNKTLK